VMLASRASSSASGVYNSRSGGHTLSSAARGTDLHSSALTYSLGSGAPVGMTINALSGVITYLPAKGTGPSVKTITVTATDNGSQIGRETCRVRVEMLEAVATAQLGRNDNHRSGRKKARRL